ncbi:MAG: glycosyltransferase family 4 protein [Candidatus Krumholzibacteriota bacterium]|nr:glycosyltransferase family 4 protein [Candidatus Krumholzibacteriota bacterium]
MSGTPKRIVVLSIWDDLWSLGEGAGVADELHFIRGLVRAGWEIHYLIPEPAGGAPPAGDGIRWHTYPNVFRRWRRLPGSLARFAWYASFDRAAGKPLRELARGAGADLLLGFSHYTCGVVGRTGRDLAIPTAVKLFGVMNLGRTDLSPLRYRWLNADQLLAFRRPVDRYIVLDDGTRGEEALARLGVPRERISFLPNGMDVEWADVAVDRAAARREFGLPPDGVLAVTLSRLVQSKRIDLFLEAAALALAGGPPDLCFVVAGDGPDRAALEAQARRLGIAERILFTGIVPHDDVVRLFKACDIFVGTNELTNKSLPPCEAILCGLPVVAFDVAATAEIVRDGETGILVDNGDVAGLATAIASLATDEPRRLRLAAGAARFGREYFVSWEDRVRMETDLFETMLAGGRNL